MSIIPLESSSGPSGPSGAAEAPAAARGPVPEPDSAILAVTLNCNARCVMCDIWKNDMHGEASPEVYKRLPRSLRDVNVSGGEPFLRKDLAQIAANVKEACPDARLVISTNGFQPERTERILGDIVDLDPNVAVRVSIDGYGDMHEQVRRIPGGYDKCVRTLDVCRRVGVKDLGIGMTVLEENVGDVEKMYEVARERGIEFTLSLPASSSIYFGEGKGEMRPKTRERLKEGMNEVIRSEALRWNPKSVFRSWFYGTQMRYFDTGRRELTCDAASGFFYMDSFAGVYLCHILDVKIGNLAEQTFDEIWGSEAAWRARETARGCHQCWMMCTSKPQLYKNRFRIAAEAFRVKASAHLGRRSFV
jgi:MoaA/NifB/PqqE/SkfB family radical SAM enzyme